MLRKIYIIALLLVLPLAARARDLNIITYSTTVTPLWEFATSSPHDNELLNGPPKAVAISFSQNVDPNRSDFTVYDPYNAALGNIKVSVKDTMMTADMPAHLQTGSYRVEWHADCMCKGTAPLQGIFHFTVQ